MLHLLETERLTKSYNGREVVKDVALTVKRGEIVGLLGPNGAGKTTTFQMIIGMVLPSRGKIFFDQQDITSFPMYRRARCGIGCLSQEPSVFQKLTVEENIMAILETLHTPPRARARRLEELLSELGIGHLAKQKAYLLSGGERRRLEITRALVTNPLFLLLDEPFSGVDPIAVAECQQMIYELKQKGLGILLTDHNVRETLAVTDRSYLMAEGKILISGTKEALLQSPEARKIYLGDKFTM